VRTMRSFHDSRRGGAIVELALVAMAVFVMLFGMIDYGRALLARHAITSLSREAANLESRGTTLQDTILATLQSSGSLDLATNGFVILTAVTRDEDGVARIVRQESRGGQPVPSRIGTLGGASVTIPNGVPLPGQTLWVAEVSVTFTPITPIANLIGVRMPPTLYDVAFF
jgi:hypothetical protein